MNTKNPEFFEHKGYAGNRIRIKPGSCENEVFVKVYDERGSARGVYAPRAALVEWLTGGKPVTPNAVVITDEMVEAAAKDLASRFYVDIPWDDLYNSTRERTRKWALSALTAALSAADIPAWEPCEPSEIKKGDRYRAEHGDVFATESVSEMDWGESAVKNNYRHFRIPAPVETAPVVEWPTEPGAYLVEWERDGVKYGPEWFVSDGETLWSTDKAFLHPESTQGGLTLLSVKKGGVTE